MDPSSNALLDPFDKMNKRCREWRGKFLSGGAWVETLLTDILATYFCPDDTRRSILFSNVFNGLSYNFSKKVDLLKLIFKKDLQDIQKRYPKLIEELSAFREFRNLLAHSHPNTDLTKLKTLKPDCVEFVLYKDGERTFKTYTDEEADRIGASINGFFKSLPEIRDELQMRNSRKE